MSNLLSILSDQPAEQVWFNVAPCAQTLAEVIAGPDKRTAQTPMPSSRWDPGRISLVHNRSAIYRLSPSEMPAIGRPAHVVCETGDREESDG